MKWECECYGQFMSGLGHEYAIQLTDCDISACSYANDDPGFQWSTLAYMDVSGGGMSSRRGRGINVMELTPPCIIMVVIFRRIIFCYHKK